METEVLIIGGGLSGLHTAYRLQQLGIEFVVAEARERLGGRILSQQNTTARPDKSTSMFDLGPTWFWPGQRRMENLIIEIGLGSQVFEQFSEGDALYEDADGNIQRGIDGISMAGSYRLQGGLKRLVDQLGKSLPGHTILKNTRVTNIHRQGGKPVSTLISENREFDLVSEYLVIALPPRLAVSSIKFDPDFDQLRASQLSSIPTWMAGHAKFIAIYDEPYWRNSGLSGDAVSQRGPLHEIHDASIENDNQWAMFGFLGVAASQRRNAQDKLIDASIRQLSRLFGQSMEQPMDIMLKDWAFEQFTSTAADYEPLMFHPPGTSGSITESTWQERIIWSGTEMADASGHNNGYLEGALEASERTVNLINTQFSAR